MANKKSKKREEMTPLMRQYHSIKAKYPNTLVLFRMGDFYETFEDDAKVTSRILNIALTKRANGAAASVPLAGFPHHALDSYLHKLIEAELRVAICEQVEDPKLAKGIVKREVVEVVTPGTTISEKYLDEKSNNFLAAIHSNKDITGFAFFDHSTGEFYVGESGGADLHEIMVKFFPKEVIIQEKSNVEKKTWFKKIRPFVTEMDEWSFNYDTSYSSLIDHFGMTSLKGFGCEDFTVGITAAGVILRYVQHNIKSALHHLTKLVAIRNEEIMGLDEFTVRNLELFYSLATQGVHGTLISVLDKTVTPGGGRLLRKRLKHPLTNKQRIENRLAYVKGFVTDEEFRSVIRRRLMNCSDLERLVGKLSRGKATPRDLANLKSTLTLIPDFYNHLQDSKNTALQLLGEQFEDTADIVTSIENTLVDSPPITVGEGGIIRDGVNEELDELRAIAKGGKDWINSMEKSEKERTGISSLKVGYNKVFGYYLEVTRPHLDKVPDSYIRKQTLVNAERFITPELKEYEEKILNAEEKLVEIEMGIFQFLRKEVLKQAAKIQTNAGVLNQIDLHATLAEVAVENHYIEPTITDGTNITVRESRHPVVEVIMPAGEKFIPNDLDISTDRDQILLVTGPNMAGKSTYLRQVGLIVVLAQMGSYVPAQKAEIGMVDSLFTRVGASDNLAGGESTFLVEMIEAANILNNVTSKSLVLFDEIGRGTATFDGLSLAWAITEFLHETPSSQPRTIFATHYHELTELEEILSRVKNYNVAVKEFGDKIVFLRKIIPGSCDKSYGIHVARMAGVPDSVIQRATKILHHLVHHESPEIEGTIPPGSTSNQLDLFSEQELRLRETLADLDIDKMTPLEALKKLDELKSEYDL